MTLYRYRAVDRAGNAAEGELDAEDRAAAVDALERLGRIPLTVDAVSTHWFDWLHHPVWGGGATSRTELVEFTRELGALLGANLSLDRSLVLLRDLFEGSAIKGVVDRATQRVRAGASLSAAFEQEPAFPEYYVSLVRAGEASGSLAHAVKRLGELLARQLAVRERIQSALIYPMILVGMVLMTFLLVVTVVLPRFELLFLEQGALLPWPTRVVLWLGEAARDYGAAIAILMFTGVVGALRLWRTAQARARVQRWLLHRRWLGQWIRARHNAAVLRTVATMLQNGIALPAALKMGAAGVTNLPVREATITVADELRKGRSLSSLLEQGRQTFPMLMVQLARVGEETGRLDELLLEASEALERESQRTIDRLLAFLVPAVTIGMGVIVAGLIGSVLMGILSVNQLV